MKEVSLLRKTFPIRVKFSEIEQITGSIVTNAMPIYRNKYPLKKNNHPESNVLSKNCWMIVIPNTITIPGNVCRINANVYGIYGSTVFLCVNAKKKKTLPVAISVIKPAIPNDVMLTQKRDCFAVSQTAFRGDVSTMYKKHHHRIFISGMPILKNKSSAIPARAIGWLLAGVYVSGLASLLLYTMLFLPKCRLR
jgi:hypothetical protein